MKKLLFLLVILTFSLSAQTFKIKTEQMGQAVVSQDTITKVYGTNYYNINTGVDTSQYSLLTDRSGKKTFVKNKTSKAIAKAINILNDQKEIVLSVVFAQDTVSKDSVVLLKNTINNLTKTGFTITGDTATRKITIASTKSFTSNGYTIIQAFGSGKDTSSNTALFSSLVVTSGTDAGKIHLYAIKPNGLNPWGANDLAKVVIRIIKYDQ